MLSRKLILKIINITSIALSVCQKNYISKVISIIQSLFDLTHSWLRPQIRVYTIVLLNGCDRSYAFEACYR